MTTARSCAFRVLYEVETDNAYANLSLQRQLRQAQLAPRDKALCSEIVYGTLQRRRTLDALVQPACSRALSDLEPEILTILRMSAYQLEFLDKVPMYAVLNEAVDLIKRHKKKAAGFVNGVLRGYLRLNGTWEERLNAVPVVSEADRLGLVLSYPTWIVEKFITTYGLTRAKAILSSLNQRSQLSVRVNALEASRDEVIQTLRDSGTDMQPSLLSESGIRLMKGLDMDDWSLFQDGLVSVQDEGAMLIAPLLDLSALSASRVLDMCAAPGTKTTHIAELTGAHGVVIAADIHAHKTELIQNAAKRLRLDNIQTMTIDARLLPQFPQYRESFDRILVDAPCTGLGVLRRRPDIRWRRNEADVEELAGLQVQLLKAAVELVKPGGAIVYATCTLLPEENQQVVKQVLADTKGTVEVDSLLNDLPQAIRHETDELGLTLTPEMFQTDGFYMCRLRKHV